jgi:hypothetical protein
LADLHKRTAEVVGRIGTSYILSSYMLLIS